MSYLFLSTLLIGVVVFVMQQKKLNAVKKDYEFLRIQNENALMSGEEKYEENDFSEAEMRRLSIVAKQTDNAIMIMDPKGNIEWINDGFTRMYEYTFEEFIRSRGSNILQTSFNPKVRERLETCIRTREPVYYEAINVTPSGRKIWTHTSLTPILDDSGKIIHLATIDSDISKRKNAGDALLGQINIFTDKINALVLEQKRLEELTYSMMDDVRNSSTRISETDIIIKFIREMSDKIRIMGLNASIEAHSVGQAGNGFRVLSNEIIKMSDETRKHAQDIFTIIGSIKGASERLNEGKMQVEIATNSYTKAVEELREEVFKVEKVASTLN